MSVIFIIILHLIIFCFVIPIKKLYICIANNLISTYYVNLFNRSILYLYIIFNNNF